MHLHIPATPATLAAAMTSIGVVIVSFNTCELLRSCLESLRGCAQPLRVVVVENGSRDDSAAMARACFPEIELITLGQNIGFAAGTNVGLRRLGVRSWELGVGKASSTFSPSSADARARANSASGSGSAVEIGRAHV